MPSPSVEDRCSLRSSAAEEHLGGTASTIRYWLLIEHAGPWGRDGLLDARLPPGVGTELREIERRVDARVLLIRRPQGMSPEGVTCVAIDTGEAWMGRVQVEGIRDALDLDPRVPAGFEPDPGPLVVVCTHGRRDPCCAERGRPLARALAAAVPEVAWESTHVGGDRFAGNLVAFPHGLYFGRVGPDEGVGIVRAYADGRIARLDRYRGRSSHASPVQAAEVSLRERSGIDGVNAVSLLRAKLGRDRAKVSFATPSGGYLIELERSSGAPMRLTCHSGHEEAPDVWRPRRIDRIALGGR